MSTDTTIKPYKPLSKNPFSFKVSTPANMAFEIQQALNKLKRKYGDIDDFVARKLKYKDKKDLYQYLGAEQIDSVAMAIHEIDNDNGLIIGDQTGIGKGRQGAAILRYAILSGRNTIFITEKSNLFSDMYRDLLDIGFSDAVPLIFNNDREAQLVVTTEVGGQQKTVSMAELTGDRRYETKTKAQLKNLIDGATELPKEYDFVMTTYSQMSGDDIAKAANWRSQGSRGKPPKTETVPQYKTQFLREYAKGAVIVMDESHNAGGSVSNVGFFVREILETAKAGIYLSATYAKRSDNLPTYAIKTAIKDAGLSTNDLINTFAKGGVAMQEIVASDLVSAGQMIRRQRTFDGIKVSYNYLPELLEEHTRVFNIVAEIIRDIIYFQKTYIEDIIASMDEAVQEREGGGASGSKREGGIDNVDYFNKIHNVIRQLLFAIKAEAVAQETIKLLNNNNKVVIAFSSTMGTFMDQLGLVDGDEISDQDFSIVLNAGLDGVMRYTERLGNGETIKKELQPDELPVDVYNAYEDIQEKIRNVSTDLSISPIDVLINSIQAVRRPNDKLGGNPSDYYRVRECTGRKGQIRLENGMAIYRSFKADKKRFFREFNNGDADVLLINQSASTGVSCHASKKFKDQRKRVMIIHQAELNINTEVQKRGRINRTGQVEVLDGKNNLPEYMYLSTSIPAEKRIFMVLKKKLKSLDANTTGSQRSSESQLEIDDFFNKYGGDVIKELLQGDKALNQEIGDPLRFTKSEEEERREKEGEANRRSYSIGRKDIPKKVTNRISILPVAAQKSFYDRVEKEYKEKIRELKQKGEYDLEVEYLDYKAETLSSGMYVPEPTDSNSPFAAAAYLDTVKAKRLRKPYKWSFIEERMEGFLEGQTPEELQKFLVKEFEDTYPAIVASEKERLGNQVARAEDLAEKARTKLLEVEARPAKTDRQKSRKEALIDKTKDLVDRKEATVQRAQEIEEEEMMKLKANEIRIKEFLQYFYVGRPVIVPVELEKNAVTFLNGVVLAAGPYYDARNPYSLSNVEAQIAVNNAWKVVNLKAAHYNQVVGVKEATRQKSDAELESIKTDWNRNSNDDATQELQIVTGNTLVGMANGLKESEMESIRLIKFSTNTGEIVPGIRMKMAKDAAVHSVVPVDNEVAMDIIKTSTKAIELKGSKKGLMFIKRYGDVYGLSVPTTNAFSPIYKDQNLLSLLIRTREEELLGKKQGSFKQAPPKHFEGKVKEEDLEQFLKILSQKHGLSMKTDSLIEVEKKDEETDDTPIPTSSEDLHWYELSEPAEVGNFPRANFVRDEPYGSLPFGRVGYTKPLTAKQKFSMGLVPLYNSPKIPYLAWRNSKQSEFVKDELARALTTARTQEPADAYETLGNAIFNYPHEEGNSEFIFGRYEPKQIGRLWYADALGKSDAQPFTLEMVVGMLRIEN